MKKLAETLTAEQRRALCALFKDLVRAARSKPPADGANDAGKDTTPPTTPRKTRAPRGAKRAAS